MAVLVFIGFNFWRIMIKQRKITLIPLTVFYVSATVICSARIVDCIAYLMYYHNDQMLNGAAYKNVGIRASVVATYFNIIMGIFQVASIIELFCVLGQIQEAAKNK